MFVDAGPRLLGLALLSNRRRARATRFDSQAAVDRSLARSAFHSDMESPSSAPVVTKRQCEPTICRIKVSDGRAEQVLQILIQSETVLLGT